MLFNSLHFLGFFPIVCLLYYLVPLKGRGLVLLAASYYFYMAWEPAYLGLILLSTIVDFQAAQAIAKSTAPALKKRWLVASMAANLGVLFTFKYANFFIDNVEGLVSALGMPYMIPHLDVLLPVGISFYTFQTMSYTIDVYRGRFAPETNFPRFALYVSFFPQLVAGPIERASHLLPQFSQPDRSRFDYDRMVSGLRQMIWGFFKKIVVADRLAVIVDAVYGSPGDYSGAALLAATYAFAFQIYCDFSGYSDIAIGVARILGYDLMENFRAPYLSKSVAEFWRRWHISLSTWFRDYVYIPLGGNRGTATRVHVNLFVVFMVSGLWHGANWTFVVWGTLHGAYLIVSRWLEKPKTQFVTFFSERRLGWFATLLSIFTCFHWVLLAWVFFRASDVQAAGTIVWTILRDTVSTLPLMAGQLIAIESMTPFKLAVLAMVVGIVTVIDIHKHSAFKLFAFTHRAPVLRQLAYSGAVVFILYFGAFTDQAQFIYFQF